MRAVPLLLGALLTACGSTTDSAAPSSSTVPSPAASRTAAPATEAPSETPAPTPVVPGWHLVARQVDGVTPREDHTWTLDSDGRVAYMFGGRTADNTALDDLWAYDLDAGEWRPVETPGRTPAARFGHNAAWVDGMGLVIFGGQAGSAFFDDLWAFNPGSERWRRLPSEGDVPVARYGSCAAIGPDGRLWISHGFTSENRRFADTRAYDFATGTWSDETPPGEVPVARCLHDCWWTDDGRLALFAGQTTGVLGLDDLWLLSVGPRQGTHAWNRADVSPRVDARNLYAAAAWGDATVIFGGQAVDGSRLDDALVLDADGAARPLDLGGNRPPARSGGELIADPAQQRLLLFGGTNGQRAFADLWELRLPAS
jgi:hypothetical protein